MRDSAKFPFTCGALVMKTNNHSFIITDWGYLMSTVYVHILNYGIETIHNTDNSQKKLLFAGN